MSTNETSPAKDPDDWTTGDEPATAAQMSYLTTLAHDSGRDVPEGVSKAEASRSSTSCAGRRRGCPGTTPAGLSAAAAVGVTEQTPRPVSTRPAG